MKVTAIVLTFNEEQHLRRCIASIGPANMGNPVEFTIRELAEPVIELTKSSSTLVNQPLPADDPQQCQPDISLTKAELGWEPVTPLKDGLLKTISYFDKMIADGLA